MLFRLLTVNQQGAGKLQDQIGNANRKYQHNTGVDGQHRNQSCLSDTKDSSKGFILVLDTNNMKTFDPGKYIKQGYYKSFQPNFQYLSL